MFGHLFRRIPSLIPWKGRPLLLLFVLAFSLSSSALPQESDQSALIKERARLWKRAQSLASQNQLDEAIASLREVLAIERKVFGSVQEEVSRTLQALAQLYVLKKDFVSARRARQEMVSLREKLYGKKDWRTEAARFAVQEIDRLRSLSDEQRKLLAQARRLNSAGARAYRAGKHGEASKLLRLALQIRERLYPKEDFPNGHPHMATSLNNLGFLLSDQDKHSQARRYYEQALEMRRRLYPKEDYPDGHPHLATSLNNLGSLLSAQGEHSQARRYYEQALEMRRRLYPKQKYPNGHPHLARSLNNLALLLHAQGEYGQARPYCEQHLEVTTRLYAREDYPNGHSNLATSLNNLGALLEAQREYGQARRRYEQALEMRRRLYPKEDYPNGHPKLATSLNNLGSLLKAQGEYGQARAYCEQALEMTTRLYPKEDYPNGHPDLTINLNNLGSLLQTQGEYGQARRYYEQALQMNKRLYPKEDFPNGHPDLAISLNNLGFLLNAQGKHGQARPYCEQGLEMQKRLYPKDDYPNGHPDLARSLNNLGGLLKTQGGYSQARRRYEQALEMRERLYPKQEFPNGHPNLANSLNNLAALLDAQGEHGQARPYCERALQMRKRLYPKENYPNGHPDLARSLHRLGMLLEAQGEYGQARPNYEQALQMREQLYPKEDFPNGHPELANCVNNLGDLLKAQGEYGQARRRYEQALQMRERLYPKQDFPNGHPELAESLNSLGLLLLAQDERAQARSYFEQALQMRERLYPKQDFPNGHPELATSLNSLGGLLQAQGEYSQARRYYEQALEMREELYPKQDFPNGHPELANCLSNLGLLFLAQGEYARAREKLLQGAVMGQNLAESFLAAASQTEALNYLAKATQRPALQGIISLWMREEKSSQDLYPLLWRRRGMVQRAIAARQRLAASLKSATSRKLYADYLQTRRSLSRLFFAPADPKHATARHDRLADLTKEKERLERELAAQTPRFTAYLQGLSQNRSPTSLLEKLPPTIAVIDFVRYRFIESNPKKPGRLLWRPPRYAAFLLQRDQPITFVDLGGAKALKQAVREWRAALVPRVRSPRPAAQRYLEERHAAQVVRRLVWVPLQAFLNSQVNTIYFCPDGVLASLPWAALPGEQKDSVLLEKYALAILPHAPLLLDQLTKDRFPLPSKKELVLVGDVRYDAKPASTRRTDLLAVRGEKRGKWKSLQGTRRELEALRRLAPAGLIQPLSGADASTANVLQALPTARFAHLATHGFFADPQFRSLMQMQQELFAQGDFLVARERRTIGGRNPLLLSGLVFAGANLPPATNEYGVQTNDAGILTAEAISGMNLWGMDLCVLSACETGLGDVAGGEGVFGLARAFHTAGARNVVASLWEVGDQATLALMKLFYHQLWKEHKSPLESLRAAQLYLYRHPDKIKELAAAEDISGFRGIDLAEAPLPTGGKNGRSKTTETWKWAAFTLSGSGACVP